MTKSELTAARNADRRAHALGCALQGLALYGLGLLIGLQTGADGVPLVEDYQGLKLVMLACFGLMLLDFYRAGRTLVEG